MPSTPQSLLDQSWLPERVTPAYEGRCISSVAGTILRLFGGAGLRTLPFSVWQGARPPRQVALVVLDALGWQLFQSARADVPTLGRLAECAQVEVLSSVFPSTTNVALTSLYTGLTPREHGMLGHLLFLREVGMSVDLLRFSLGGEFGREVPEARGLKPREFVVARTLFERLAALGVAGTALTRHSIKGSALAQIHHEGAEVIPYITASDLVVTLRRFLEREGEAPRFIFAYWDLIDTLSHLYRPDSLEVRAEVAAFFSALQREVLDALAPAARADTLLLLVADHGQLAVPPDNAVTVAAHPQLTELLMVPPNGGPRYAYLHPLPGREEAVRAYLGALSDQFLVLDAADAMERGLWGLGATHPEALHRTGPLVALAQGQSRFYRSHIPPHILAMHGIHGGLSAEEMLVPFVALPLSEW
jgi:Type I phosphodiesterase / nucleotide pyrophosphatase